MSIATPHFSYIPVREAQRRYRPLENGQWLLIINLGCPITAAWSMDVGYDFAGQTLNFVFIPKGYELRLTTSSADLGNYGLLVLHPLWLDNCLDISEKRSKNYIEKMDKPALWSFCAKHIPQRILPALEILQELVAENFYQQCLAEALVRQILAQTVPLFKEGGCNHACHIRERDYQKVRQAEQFIRANINESCVLLSIAKQVGMNDYSLKRAFKEVYGTSIFNYLHNLRMQRALALLHQDLSIGQIADEIGYKNHSNFTAAFKRTYGYSPKEIRRNRLKSPLNSY